MEKFIHAINIAAGSDYRILKRWWYRFQNWRYIWELASFEELKNALLIPIAPAALDSSENPRRVLLKTATKTASRLINMRRNFDVNAEFAQLWNKDIVLIGRDCPENSPEYPKALLPLDDAPFLLYRKGASLERLNSPTAQAFALVGTRNPSRYGEKIAYDLAEALVKKNVTIISGLALGIDAIGHFAAVSNKKPTIAVLASGLFEVTPSTHHRLAEKILERDGTLISEYPPNDPAFSNRFLERNRIIAGMCEATIVIEAPQRSGALATARRANEYGKEVYCLPGDINRPQAQGCLELIYHGAHPLINLQWFLEDCGLAGHAGSSNSPPAQLSATEKQLLEGFEGAPCSVDALFEKTLLPIQTLCALLTQLEAKGIVYRNSQFLWEFPVSPALEG